MGTSGGERSRDGRRRFRGDAARLSPGEDTSGEEGATPPAVWKFNTWKSADSMSYYKAKLKRLLMG